MAKKGGNRLIFVLISIIIVGGIIWLFSFLGDRGDSQIDLSIKTGEPVPLGEGQEVSEKSFNTNSYKHSILGFSFEYQKDYNISSFGNFYDSTGETILLQKNNSTEGLQVLITPFDEDIDLTIARIKKDLPNLSVINAKESTMGADNKKVQVVFFESGNSLSTGQSLEAWFIYRNNLYQISAQLNSRDLFDKITSSWNFQ